MLFKMTEAAMGGPDRLVSEVIYPAVPGGAETLAALLQEYRTQGTGYRQHKQRVFKASCTHHYRKGLIQLLDACRIRITQGKGAKDRYVPFPATFKKTLALHISAARDNGAAFLFESSWGKPYSTRGVRAMLARYAVKARYEASGQAMGVTAPPCRRGRALARRALI